MKERLSNLLCIKSIVTVFMTLVFCYLSITGRISETQFMTVFIMVIGFYFGTQAERKKGSESDVKQ